MNTLLNENEDMEGWKFSMSSYRTFKQIINIPLYDVDEWILMYKERCWKFKPTSFRFYLFSLMYSFTLCLTILKLTSPYCSRALWKSALSNFEFNLDLAVLFKSTI